MRDRPSPEQITWIRDLARGLGLDDAARFQRIRSIVGRPTVMLSQLTPAEADTVIADLEADIQQPTLPIGDSHG